MKWTYVLSLLAPTIFFSTVAGGFVDLKNDILNTYYYRNYDMIQVYRTLEGKTMRGDRDPCNEYKGNIREMNTAALHFKNHFLVLPVSLSWALTELVPVKAALKIPVIIKCEPTDDVVNFKYWLILVRREDRSEYEFTRVLSIDPVEKRIAFILEEAHIIKRIIMSYETRDSQQQIMRWYEILTESNGELGLCHSLLSGSKKLYRIHSGKVTIGQFILNVKAETQITLPVIFECGVELLDEIHGREEGLRHLQSFVLENIDGFFSRLCYMNTDKEQRRFFALDFDFDSDKF